MVPPSRTGKPPSAVVLQGGTWLRSGCPGKLTSMSVNVSNDENRRPENPYDEKGIDRSLIRWMLSLTPTERLDHLEGALQLLESPRAKKPR